MAKHNGKIRLQPGEWVWVEWMYDGAKVATVGVVVKRGGKRVYLCQSQTLGGSYVGPPPKEIELSAVTHVESLEVEGGE